MAKAASLCWLLAQALAHASSPVEVAPALRGEAAPRCAGLGCPAPPCLTGEGGQGKSPEAVCEKFCRGQCAFYNRSRGDTAGRQVLTLYRLTPPNITGMRNKDLGDAYGDVSYWISTKNRTRECQEHPGQHGCITADHDKLLYGVFTIEVDGQFGPYMECNPVNQGPDALQHPVWKDTRQFKCGLDCIVATEEGCFNISIPRNGTDEMGSHTCHCDGTGRHERTVGRAEPPLLRGGWAWTPDAWVPQCRRGFWPVPEGQGITGMTIRTLHGWSFESTQTLACEACSKDPKCKAWSVLDNFTAKLFGSMIVPSVSKPLAAAARIETDMDGSWFGTGRLGGWWYSFPAAGECAPRVPLGAGGCTWRELTSFYKKAACVDGMVDLAVQRYNGPCFNRCPHPLNMTSDCYLECFRDAVDGNAAKNLTKLPSKRLVDAWLQALQEEEPARGGCPLAVPESCEGPQCDPLVSGAPPGGAPAAPLFAL